MATIGIIGGSGLYNMDGFEDPRWVDVTTPWGDPSDQLLTGTMSGTKVVFLPRHGRGHVHSPTAINYRANIDALRQLDVQTVVSISACGSFQETMAPGDFVVVDQFIDRTFAREKSFFGTGCVAHVGFGNPTCEQLSQDCVAAGEQAGITMHQGGTYLAMEGPQFSSKAESKLYKSWGCDVIGMTNMPEAKLAREAEMCYATVAMVTDFDSWHPGHDNVDVASVIATLQGNGTKAAQFVKNLVGSFNGTDTPCPHGCNTALDFAVMTAPEKRDPSLVAKLATVAGRVLSS